jgi:hypothetical protein
MSGLVNGVLAGTGAFEICNRFDSERELQQRDFFGPLRRTKLILLAAWNGFGGVWHSGRG